MNTCIRFFVVLAGTAAFLSNGMASRADEAEDKRRAQNELRRLLSAQDAETMLVMVVKEWKKDLGKGARKELVVLCVDRLKSPTPLPLLDTSDLNIPSRIKSGKMKPHFPGTVVNQDLFYENGRCAFAIEQLLGVRLPDFIEDMSKEQLEEAMLESCKRIIKKMIVP